MLVEVGLCLATAAIVTSTLLYLFMFVLLAVIDCIMGLCTTVRTRYWSTTTNWRRMQRTLGAWAVTDRSGNIRLLVVCMQRPALPADIMDTAASRLHL